MINQQQINEVQTILQNAKRLFVLTGAGVSAESNVPTFRGGGGSGVWRGMPFEVLSSAKMVDENLPLVWEWFDYRRTTVGNCAPNAAHKTLAAIQASGRFDNLTLVTQNIDGLHQAAGAENVIELHGSIWRTRCLSCGAKRDLREIPEDERPPVCLKCADSMRPDVMLFGEAMPMESVYEAQNAARESDVRLVIGTSALVYPAAELPLIAAQAGAKLIEINPEATALTDAADFSTRGAAGEILPLIFAQNGLSNNRLPDKAAIKSSVKQNTLEVSAENDGHFDQSASLTNDVQQFGSNYKTSESHPIRVDFLKSESFPELNKLGMTFAPGKKQTDAMSGNWQRDLSADIARLRDYYKVDTLVSLIEEHELDALGISNLVQECQAQNIEIIRFPIADYSLPSDEDEYMLLIGKIVDRLYQNKNVVIHCKGGLGRAGMTAACAIVAATDDEISGEEAIKIVRSARKGTVETGKQEEFVRSFGDLLGEFENSDADESFDDEFSSAEEAIDYYAELTAKEPDNAEAFYNLGVAFDQNDQLDEAIAAYEKAIEINSTYAEAHYNLGQIYLQANQLKEAENSFITAVLLTNGFAPAHFMLGVVYAAWGKYHESIAATERGLEFAPEDAMAHFNVGKSLYALGEFEKAAESFGKACEYAPDFPDAFYLLGKCHREFGEKVDEFDAYLEAVEIAPDFADAMFALGTVYAHLTETPEGEKVKYLESHGELNLDDARIFLYMGLAQLALGNVETVIERQPELREMDEGLAEQLKFFIDYFNEHKVMLIDIGNEWMEEPEELNLDPEKLKKFRGCLLGGAVGDALGAAIEFDSIERIRQKLGAEGLTDYAPAYGRTGAITDDTQMTLFTAEGLLRGQTRHMHKGMYSAIRVIYFAYMRWLETQGIKLNDNELKYSVYDVPSWLRDLPELNSRRAPGNSCLSALQSGNIGTIEKPINNSKGCGGVMRVAPIGLVAFKPFSMAMDAAAITHGHPTGYLSAGVLALIINQIIKGKSLTEAVNRAVYDELPKHKDYEETFAACDKAVKLAADRSIHPTPETVELLGAGWIAEEALAISIYCALVYENDFEKALLLAVNHTGDSDSTGAITGNILGALHGVDVIPENWLARLELKETILEIAEDLLISFRTGEEWWNKYPGV